MEKFNRNALVVTMVLLACLLIVGTIASNGPVLAAHAEASGGQVMQPETVIGSGFTYQGSLKSGGSPANGQFDFQFTLYDSLAGGSLAAGPITTGNVTVANGLFTVLLDFGASAITGEARYLEIAVRQTGGGTYTTLTPRQSLTPAPYALSLKPGAVISGTTGSGVALLGALNSGNGYGIYGESTANNGTGLSGVANTGTEAKGVYGLSTNGTAVEGFAANGKGVYGLSTNGIAVVGENINGVGVVGNSINSEGVHGESTSDHAGVFGYNGSTGGIGPGVSGLSFSGPGMYGYGYGNKGVWGQSVTNDGVYGTSDTLSGVAGFSTSGYGVYGYSNNSYAGWFQGNVRVTGSCCSSSAGTYQIDDPLDPANKYLNQSAVESPDMKTIYDGIAILDATGEAWVAMPAYFEALNRDFRYQLTPIGAPGHDLYLAQEVENNRFKIAGGSAGMKVSWQVTGIRHDPYATQNPATIEQDKPAGEIGKYIHPEAYGQPEALGIGYEQSQSDKPATPPIAPTRPDR